MTENTPPYTILIKAFERPEALDRCLLSVRAKCPGASVIIADDSKKPLEPDLLPNERVLRLPFDSGLSAGRNALMGQCKTKYFLLLDDDSIIKSFHPDIFKQLGDDVHVVAGVMDGIEDWKGSFRMHHGRLVHLYNKRNDRGHYDFVPNFFVGETSRFKKLLWDTDLKVCEHSEFFYRHKLQCEVSDNLTGANARDRSERYNKFRGRSRVFQPIEKKKLGVYAFDFVDPDNIRALLVKNPRLYDHPQGCREEFGERLGDCNPHSIESVWEADIVDNPNFPWHKYNLVISNFAWAGMREKPKHIRGVYINDDMHWNANPEVLKDMREVIGACDMFLTPYGHHGNKIPEYKKDHHKFVHFPYAIPWWFEPGQWDGREAKVTISGGTHHEIYPLRTKIVEAAQNGLCGHLEWLGDHPGWSIADAPDSISRDKYARWMNGFQGGIATYGFGRFPSGNIPYLVCKYLEVAASTCPFFEELPDNELEMLGFKPYEHYIPITEDDWEDKLDEWLSQPDEMRRIFLNSSTLVASNHYIHHRVKHFWALVKGVFGWH